MNSQIKDSLAAAFAEELRKRVSHQVFVGRSDRDVAPPFTVVVVKRLQKIDPGINVYYADMRVVHVSEVADSTSDQHDKRVTTLELALADMPRCGVDTKRDIELHGFYVDEVEDAINREDDVFGDVFVIRAGCGRSS